MLCLILFLALFATLSCSKEPPTSSSPESTSSSSPDNISASSPDDPPSSPDNPPSSSSLVSPPSDEVVIPDANLRTYIEKELKKNPGTTITQAEMNTHYTSQHLESMVPVYFFLRLVSMNFCLVSMNFFRLSIHWIGKVPSILI